MKIGRHTVTNPLILAPMAGVTDFPFRSLCRALGAGLTPSEMVAANPKLRNSRKSQLRLSHHHEESPRIVQIAGGNAAMLADAARYNADLGAEVIDINMGCPAKKVCNKAAGSALLKDEKHVQEILEAVVKAVDIPVTLKTRTGWDTSSKNYLRIAKIAEDAGIAALALHGRTRADRFQGQAEYDSIAEVKTQIKIPVIANGDIDSPQKAHQVLRHTNADALMIGRAAQGNPWIFLEINHYLQTGERLAPPSNEEVLQTLTQHLNGLYNLYGEFMGPRIARKHVGWYLKTRPNSESFRREFNKIDTAKVQLETIAVFFE